MQNLAGITLSIFVISWLRGFLSAGFCVAGEHLSLRFPGRQIVPAELPRFFNPDFFQAFLTTALDTLLYAAFLYFGLIRFQPRASFPESAATFLGLFLWVEMSAYYLHWLVHHRRFYWMHRRHHETDIPGPFTSLSFSLCERLLVMAGALILPLSVLSHFFPVPIIPFSLYVVCNRALGAWAHMNFEWMPRWFPHTPVGQVFITSTFHSLHHSRSRGNYGLFTRVFDRIHGTEFADYASLPKGRG